MLERGPQGEKVLTCDPSTMTSLARDAWRSVYQCYAQVDAAAAGRPLGICEMAPTWNEFAREYAVEIRQLRSQSHMPPLDGAQLHTACQARRKTAASGSDSWRTVEMQLAQHRGPCYGFSQFLAPIGLAEHP